MHFKFLLLALAVVPQFSPAATLTVTTVDNYLSDGASVAPGSFLEALQTAGAGDTINFNIAGSGPQVIATPQDGYPLITVSDLTINGYSQPGASPNTNPILGGNNAHLKIVLDSRTGPGQRTLLGPLNNPGFGNSESAILGLLGASNVTLKGLSFLSRYTAESDTDPDIYCVALINDSTGARLQGCWFGLAPDGTTVAGGRSSVASFKGDGGTSSSGLIFGTDGDGVNDVAEFNLSLGMELAIHLETPNVKVSGNYINVFPDGLTFLDVEALADSEGTTVEAIENGEGHNMVIGTDGDGVSDANERNIIGHSVYDRIVEFWGARATNVVIAGNYFGVGVDGHTPAPVPTSASPDFVQIKSQGSIRIGSNGDGVSDTLEGNLFFNTPGAKFVDATSPQTGDNITKTVVRRNQFSHCGFAAIPFADSAVNYVSYYASVVADATVAVPVLNGMANGILSGSFAAPDGVNYSDAIIDVYAVDGPGLVSRLNWPRPLTHPSSWLGAYKDNVSGDLDPATNSFSFDLSALGLSASTYVAVAVTYANDTRDLNAGRAVTSPMSNPVATRPAIRINYVPPDIELSWLAPQSAFNAQFNEDFDPALWVDLLGETYSDGRNILTTSIDLFGPPILFYRLIAP